MQLLIGPPTTVRSPCARQRDNIRSMLSFCTSIALMSTTSAHFKSASLTGRILTSTRRCSQLCGSSDATVSRPSGGNTDLFRSEEHTSELQSHSDLVCRLLLEKKKKYHHRLPGTQRRAARSRRDEGPARHGLHKFAVPHEPR